MTRPVESWQKTLTAEIATKRPQTPARRFDACIDLSLFKRRSDWVLSVLGYQIITWGVLQPWVVGTDVYAVVPTGCAVRAAVALDNLPKPLTDSCVSGDPCPICLQTAVEHSCPIELTSMKPRRNDWPPRASYFRSRHEIMLTASYWRDFLFFVSF